MTASRQNCNAASLLFFLHRIVDVSSFGNYKLFPPEWLGIFLTLWWSMLGPQVFKHYFEELEEESLRDNFVVVVRRYLYHLFGLYLIMKFCDFMRCLCPFFVVWVAWWDDGLWLPSVYWSQDSQWIYQDWCLQDGSYTETSHGCNKCGVLAQWRDTLQEEWGRRMGKKEDYLFFFGTTTKWISFLSFNFQVFLDVVESVNILVNSNGQIIRSDVVGALKMRTYLRCVSILTQWISIYAWAV